MKKICIGMLNVRIKKTFRGVIKVRIDDPFFNRSIRLSSKDENRIIDFVDNEIARLSSDLYIANQEDTIADTKKLEKAISAFEAVRAYIFLSCKHFQVNKE